RDEWVLPGDEVAITFERVGTLHQKIGEPTGTPRSRWAQRHDVGL
ncbi:MAG: fumarylacetoacetate hydrolase family protein, partial [Actinobacteria bacterium ATB1]|nr:fumarylacetoacetate hydrolase family protein [Actinobacteria bacterium ATB1]